MSFITNIQIQKTYPAVQFEPDTVNEPSGIWHEDHEINGAMYRAANAKFTESLGTWSLQVASQPAYAEVKNTDGSVSTLYKPANSMPWSTSLWVGTGQPLIYHAVNYGLDVNDPSGGVKNQQALQAAVSAAFNGGGGVVFIPPGVYQITGTITINNLTPGSDHGMIIAGVGGDTELVQNSFADLFSFSGFNSGRGVRLRDLRLTFGATGTGSSPNAVKLASCQNVTCERVWFRGFPSTMIDDNNTEQCGLSDCNIDYTSSMTGQTMVTFTGTQEFIDNCVISNTNKAANCTGLLMTSFDTAYITNTHISDFDYGIQIQGGGGNLHHGFFSNISCQSVKTSLTIKPASNGQKIYELFFLNCIFERTHLSTNTTPGILIHTNGGTSDKVSDICFANCMSHDWAGPGMEINGGQDIVVTGGRYGQNATDNSMTASGAIAVTGPAVRVSIVGSDCSGVIPSYSAQPTANNPQPYGISVTGTVVSMKVRDCDLTNNHSGGLYVPAAGADLQVTDCAGYNDQADLLASVAPSNGSIFLAPTFNYYGPMTFYVSGGTLVHIQIDGHDSTLASGSFILNPGHSGTLLYDVTHPKPNFVALGM